MDELIRSLGCNDGTFSKLQLWDLPTGTGQVRLHGTDLCLDAGDSPANGVEAKVWSCGDYPQQQWAVVGNTISTVNSEPQLLPGFRDPQTDLSLTLAQTSA
jgi:hypothetical protein